MSDVRIKPGPKFPSTQLLEACYNDIVPNEYADNNHIDTLDNLWCREGVSDAVGECPTHLKDDCSLNKSESHNVLHTELASQISQLQRSIHLQEQAIQQLLPKFRTLVSAVKADVAIAATDLSWCTQNTPSLSRVRKRSFLTCCKCSNKHTLPFTKFCLKHIHLSPSQLLYRRCTALDPHPKTPCGLPVLDILSLESVCPKHVRIGDTGGISKPSIPSRKPGARGVTKSGGVATGTKIRGSKQVVSKILPRVKIQPKPAALTSMLKLVVEDTPVYLKTVNKQEVLVDELPPDKKVAPVNQHILALEDVPCNQQFSGKVTVNIHKQTLDKTSRGFDDLLTLGAPLPTLDLPPLEADLGDIMMAGEESSDEEGMD